MPFPSDAPERIARKVDEGSLPLEMPDKMYAGYGSGQPCDGCDQRITLQQVEYEFEVGERRFRMHMGCAGLLEAERRIRGTTESS